MDVSVGLSVNFPFIQNRSEYGEVEGLVFGGVDGESGVSGVSGVRGVSTVGGVSTGLQLGHAARVLAS